VTQVAERRHCDIAGRDRPISQSHLVVDLLLEQYPQTPVMSHTYQSISIAAPNARSPCRRDCEQQK
jgi:hypothetical protein